MGRLFLLVALSVAFAAGSIGCQGSKTAEPSSRPETSSDRIEKRRQELREEETARALNAAEDRAFCNRVLRRAVASDLCRTDPTLNAQACDTVKELDQQNTPSDRGTWYMCYKQHERETGRR